MALLLKRRDGAFERRDRFITSTLAERLQRDPVVLNVGCGNIPNRTMIPSCGAFLTTDIRRLPSVDFVSDAMALSVATASVDTVLALELLEHVPRPGEVLAELCRVLRPSGTAVVSVPSAVPRHDSHDYWRYTAQGLAQLCSEVFNECEVFIFGETLETLGYIAGYYARCVAHRSWAPLGHLSPALEGVGRWLDRRQWWTPPDGLHTLALDLVAVARADEG